MSASLTFPLLVHCIKYSTIFDNKYSEIKCLKSKYFFYFLTKFIEVKVKDLPAFTLVEVTRKHVQSLQIMINTSYLIP